MSIGETLGEFRPDEDGAISRMTGLIEEATRQLNICNSCRYCEGLCAVFPALERRTLLEPGDISQIANLCHDCRGCYDACMYTPPHEFSLNLPRVLSAVRVRDYSRYMWPGAVPRLFRGWLGLVGGFLISTAVVLVLAVLNVGLPGLVRTTNRAESPYVMIPYPVLLGLILLATAYACGVLALAGRRYWLEVATVDYKVGISGFSKAIWSAATLHYLRGGGGECYYPEDDRPSGLRRRLHSVVAYGFGLCLVSTIAAGILQDIIGQEPPYPWLSVPVISGTIGGLGLIVGSSGLLALKTKSSAVTSVAEMTVKDYGLLAALSLLALSGLATLLTRSTAAFGVILLIHLSAVVLAIASAPYSKFSHIIFRFLAIVHHYAEAAVDG
jgi:citrate/tricarballylate utilization protein